MWLAYRISAPVTGRRNSYSSLVIAGITMIDLRSGRGVAKMLHRNVAVDAYSTMSKR
jgi:hypothetical protein